MLFPCLCYIEDFSLWFRLTNKFSIWDEGFFIDRLLRKKQTSEPVAQKYYTESLHIFFLAYHRYTIYKLFRFSSSFSQAKRNLHRRLNLENKQWFIQFHYILTHPSILSFFVLVQHFTVNYILTYLCSSIKYWILCICLFHMWFCSFIHR